jgi:hypothetical protein
MLLRLGLRIVFAGRFVPPLLCLQLVLESASVCAKGYIWGEELLKVMAEFWRCVTIPRATGKRVM